jgi:hypothetical protein
MTDLSPKELMDLQLEAGYTHNGDSRLLTVNEPWDGTVPAPRFVLGRTIDGAIIRRYRFDLAPDLVECLEDLAAGEIPARDFGEQPKHFDKYLQILGGEKFNRGPCFLIPPGAGSAAENPVPLIPVTRNNFSAEFVQKLQFLNNSNIENYSSEGFEWLIDEIDVVQPCVACIRQGRIVSQCRSVRISPRAHEAGLETLEGFRGRGLAPLVTAGWARAVRQTGALPFYSTSWKNTASQNVARKMALYYYGNTFSVF